MERTKRDDGFYAEISEGALLPEDDARVLVCDFLNAISSYVNDDAWDVLIDLAPADVDVERDNGEKTDGTIEDFLLAMSDTEGVDTERAAQHARVVAETLRSRADRSHLAGLLEFIENEELLALFELSRGELTELRMPTAGERAQSGELKPDDSTER